MRIASELCTLARTCSFDHLEASFIKDRLVLGVGDSALKERLLCTQDLDLQKAYDVFRKGRIMSSADARVRWCFRSILGDASRFSWVLMETRTVDV